MPLNPDPAPMPVVVDTDGGVDDAAALWFLLTCPAVDVVAITTTGGNVDAGVAADNIARVVQLAGSGPIPIAVGADGTFGPHPVLRRASAIHGDDGVGDTGRRPHPWQPSPLDTTTLLAHHITANARGGGGGGGGGGGVTILTLGPLTNLARLVTERPDVVPLVAQVVVMGGTVALQGNALPTAEANIAHDPAAAACVAAAPWVAPPLLVPLDVTLRATLGPAEFAALEAGGSAAARDLAAPLAFYRRLGGTFSPEGESPCHDLTAAIVAVEPDLVSAPVLPFGVDTSGGLAWGTTVVDRRRPFFDRGGANATQAIPDGLSPWRIGLDVDVDAVRARYRSLFT